MLDSVQTVGASLRVQQEQPLCSEILVVQQFFFRQRMVNRENSRDADLRQLLVNAGRFFSPFSWNAVTTSTASSSRSW